MTNPAPAPAPPLPDSTGTLRVYVAGSSRELERAEAMIAALRGIPGVEVTYDWPAAVRAAGSANAGLSDRQAVEAVQACLSGAIGARVFLALLPPEGVPADGLMYELATYHAARFVTEQQSLVAIVGSCDRSIFLRGRDLDAMRCGSDAEAQLLITALVSMGAH